MIVNNTAMRFPTPPEPSASVKAHVVVKEMFDQGNDVWPDRFLIEPQCGDVIQSDTGRRLTILDVVHSISNGEPVLQIEIGVDRKDNTPTGGGGGDLL